MLIGTLFVVVVVVAVGLFVVGDGNGGVRVNQEHLKEYPNCGQAEVLYTGTVVRWSGAGAYPKKKWPKFRQVGDF